MATIKALEFEKHLAEERLRPAYALVGDDEALISSCVAALKTAVDRPELPGSTVSELEEVEQPREALDELRTQPFLGMEGVRLVIVREGDKLLSQHGDALQSYLKAPSPAGVLVLCCEKLDGRLAVVKTLSASGVVVECNQLRWREARSWLEQEAQGCGKTFTPHASSALVEAVGPNLVALRQELEKLMLYAGEETTITEDDVEEVVPQSRSRSIFDLSDAVSHSDVAEAIRLGQNLLLRGDRPERIVGFLGRQTRLLWQAKRLSQQGQGEKEIARELGIPTFAARKAIRTATQLDKVWFKRKLELLAAADTELKTTAISSREQGVWLDHFLAKLCR